MGYNLLINGVNWGYNPLSNLLLTSWDIQVRIMGSQVPGGLEIPEPCYAQSNPCFLEVPMIVREKIFPPRNHLMHGAKTNRLHMFP